jgi:excisionase family DNA binding protein
MPVEVKVPNPGYWTEHSFQLAQILRTHADRAGTVPDPSQARIDPETILTIADPSYWAEQHGELAEAIAVATGIGNDGRPTSLKGVHGIAAESGARLTMSVEEAAKALGISRALAYEAVSRNEIPHIRIGRRILIPRAQLGRLVGEGSSNADQSE